MRISRLIVLTVAAGLALVTTTAAPAKPSANGHRGVTVMTRNLYLGAELTPVMEAGGFGELQAAVSEVWDGVQATDFTARVVGIADEIEAAKPDLIGLQEAALWRIESPGNGPANPATEVVYDFVEILLDELDSRKLRYEVAVSQELFDVELPNMDWDDIRYFLAIARARSAVYAPSASKSCRSARKAPTSSPAWASRQDSKR